MKHPLLLAFLAYAGVVSASQDVALVKALTECSPEYFAKVHHSTDFASAGYSFTQQGRLIVRSHRDELGSGYRVMGSRKLSVAGLEVVGMYDLHRKAFTYEALEWGLLVKGAPKDLVRRINELLPQDRALEADQLGLGFARLDVSSVSTWPKWTTPRPLPKEAPTKFGDVEMAMEVVPEDYDELPGVSRVGCSMQGVFPPFVLKVRRPDIE